MIPEMKKCDLTVHADDADSIAGDIVCLCLREKNFFRFQKPEGTSAAGCGSNVGELRETLALLESAVKNLAPLDKEKKRVTEPLPELSREIIDSPSQDYYDAVKAAGDVGICFRAKDDYMIEKKRLASIRTSLEPGLNCDLPVGFSGTAGSIAVFGTIPVTVGESAVREEIESRDLAAEIFVAGKDTGNIYTVIICYRGDETGLYASLDKFGFVKTDFTDSADIEGSAAAEKIAEIDRRFAALDTKIAETESALSVVAAQTDKMKVACDIISAKILKAELKESFFMTESAVFIQGYIPAEKTAGLEAVANKYACCLDISDIPPDDYKNIPVLPENNKRTEGLYSGWFTQILRRIKNRLSVIKDFFTRRF